MIAQFTSFAVVTITARIFTEINVMNEIIKNINKDQDVCFSILINKGEDYNDHVIRNMTRSIIHRGPNNFGFSNETLGDFEVNIGHARLSIIDLQENSNQPF